MIYYNKAKFKKYILNFNVFNLTLTLLDDIIKLISDVRV